MDTTTTLHAVADSTDPLVTAAWLDGYDTGQHIGATLGTRDAWTEGYDAGHAAGIEAARRQLDAEAEAAADEHRSRVHADLRQDRPAFDELCDRRAATADEHGHHETAAVERARAARQRWLLRANGVVPMHTATGHVYPANWPESERYCAHAVATVAGSPARHTAPAITPVRTAA
ncbi:hypothetical protein [Promicromonospora sp. NPDC050262]|uniref:hypothetical protein n=1 Tax=Promicromonospora sp. NPDC050262 TaxID=3155036 RepID=UPI0033FC536C